MEKTVAATDAREYLTAEEILAHDDREVVEVQVRQWKNKWVTLRALDARQAVVFQDIPEAQKKEAWIQLVVLSAVRNVGTKEEPEWVPMFTEAQAQELRSKSAAAMISLQKHIAQLNGFNELAAEQAKND